MNEVGLEIGSVILGLHARGIPVTLYFCKKWGATEGSHDDILFNAPVNPGGGPLDVAFLAAIFQAWFHRRIMFALLETQSPKIRTAFGVSGMGSYGRSISVDANDARHILAGSSDVPVIVNVREWLGRPHSLRVHLEKKCLGGR